MVLIILDAQMIWMKGLENIRMGKSTIPHQDFRLKWFVTQPFPINTRLIFLRDISNPVLGELFQIGIF